jgi:hypothetical protein
VRISWFLCLAATLLCSIALANAQTTMAQEEQSVRAAYLKMSYAAQECFLAEQALSGTSSLLNSPDDLNKRMSLQVPTFQITDISIGDVSSVGTMPWSRLVSKPEGDVINVVATKIPHAGKNMFCPHLSWAERGNYQANDWEAPTSDVVAKMQKASGIVYGRYASYTVTVSLEARTRTYHAAFLMGKTPNGKDMAYPVDHILGMGSLNFVIGNSMYPVTLLETSFRDLPSIKEWIGTAALTCKEQREVRDICCDPVAGKCGLPQTQLDKSKSVVLSTEDDWKVPAKKAGGSQ